MEENQIYTVIWCTLISGKKEKNTAEPSEKKIYIIYGNPVIAESTVPKCFANFRIRTFDLEDCERSNRPTVVNDDHMKTLMKNNTGHRKGTPHICHRSVVCHLRTLGYEESLQCLAEKIKGPNFHRFSAKMLQKYSQVMKNGLFSTM